MKHKLYLLATLLLSSLVSQAQELQLKGQVLNAKNQPLEGAYVYLEDNTKTTSAEGAFEFKNLKSKSYQLTISHIGFEVIDTVLTLKQDVDLKFHLKEDAYDLDQVLITTDKIHRQTANVQVVDDNYLKQEYTGSLATSMSKLPGVNAMEIGAGSSKPIIRGFSLNRVAVAENGVKQEGQQWGADHGLEIDALAIDQMEIVKGIGAIEYGSDAIGGLLKINSLKAPKENGLKADIFGIAKSVNQTIGTSAGLSYKADKMFYKLHFTAMDFGDYSLPTDQINYLNYDIPIYNERLKNTAGHEMNWSGQVGYQGEIFESAIHVSNVYQKSGFFPGSHGIPSIDRVKPDGDRRNIGFPYQNVNHFKILNDTRLQFENAELQVLLSFQDNHRQEWSLFHTHYASQEPPEVDPDLELDFKLKTYDAQAKLDYTFTEKHSGKIGVQTKWQDNAIDGYNFLLPAYQTNSLAAFYKHQFRAKDDLLFDFGVRFDYSAIDIERYFDDNLYDYLINKGSTSAEANKYALRSPDLDKNFSSFNAMAGVAYDFDDHFSIKSNFGTNFRLPTAIELGANGIHHGSFRHERGNKNLDAEKSFVVDLDLEYKTDNFIAKLSPYAYYFSNYIFLKPTLEFSVLPHSGQIYSYEQSEALLSGVELMLEKNFDFGLRTLAVGEYIRNQQITDSGSSEYPLPFTPANNLFLEVGQQIFNESHKLTDTEVYFNSTIAMKQD
ncbi:MAG: TonB-dependent receptor, partial [Psychroflexus sp.]|nr:TonB-dependent receptor [Psychroflexus sp.]